jgi:drug/metabolite transporter (DMT)-like permease
VVYRWRSDPEGRETHATHAGTVIDTGRKTSGGPPSAAPASGGDTPPVAPGAGGHRARAAVALAALALIWGYSWAVTKIGLRYSQPFVYAALRMTLSALILLAAMAVLGRPLRPVALRWALLIGMLQTAGFAGLTTSALSYGGAGKVSVLVYTMPFWLLLLAWIVLGEHVRGVQWLAVGLALAGFLLILSPWRLQGVTATLLAVGGGLCWAGGGITIKALDRRRHVDILSLTAWQMLLGSIPLIVVALATWESPVWSGSFIAALAYTTVLANALAWYLWHYSLRTLPTGLAGFGTLAIPVVAVVTAWMQLGEVPGVSEALGMTCIIGALAVLTVSELLRSRHQTGRGAAAPAIEEDILMQ